MKTLLTNFISVRSLAMILVLGIANSCNRYDAVQKDYGLNDRITLRRDKNGVFAIRNSFIVRKFDWLQEASNDSLSLFRRKGKYGFLNTNTGRIRIPAKYRRAWPFSEGLAAVQENGLIGFINHEGLFEIEPQFPAYNGLTDYSFHSGFCVVGSSNRKYGIIDESGTWVLTPEYTYAFACKDYAIVAKDGIRMQVLYDGTVLNPSVLEEITELSFCHGDWDDDRQETQYVGYYSYCSGGRWGLMDDHCNRLTEPLYTNISALNEKVFRATLLDEVSAILVNTKDEILE